MINTIDNIRSLLQDKPSEILSWYYLTGENDRYSLVGYLSIYYDDTESLGDIFNGELQESDYWDSENDYSCTGFYYRGELFLVKDEWCNGEDSWNDDEEIIDKAIAAKVTTIIIDAVKDYQIKKLLEN